MLLFSLDFADKNRHADTCRRVWGMYSSSHLHNCRQMKNSQGDLRPKAVKRILVNLRKICDWSCDPLFSANNICWCGGCDQSLGKVGYQLRTSPSAADGSPLCPVISEKEGKLGSDCSLCQQLTVNLSMEDSLRRVPGNEEIFSH